MNKRHIIIWIIIVVIVGTGGYYIGVKHASGAVSATGRGGASGYAGFAGRAGGAGGATGVAGGTAVTGQIVSMDSQSITVALRAGGSQVIFYTPTTSVSKMVSVAPSTLSVGTSVIVTGTSNSDGSLTAATIQVRPATTTPAASVTAGQ